MLDKAASPMVSAHIPEMDIAGQQVAPNDSIVSAVDPAAPFHFIGEAQIRVEVFQPRVMELVSRDIRNRPPRPRPGALARLPQPGIPSALRLVVHHGMAPTILQVLPRQVRLRARYINPPHSA